MRPRGPGFPGDRAPARRPQARAQREVAPLRCGSAGPRAPGLPRRALPVRSLGGVAAALAQPTAFKQQTTSWRAGPGPPALETRTRASQLPAEDPRGKPSGLQPQGAGRAGRRTKAAERKAAQPLVCTWAPGPSLKSEASSAGKCFLPACTLLLFIKQPIQRCRTPFSSAASAGDDGR